MFDGLVKSSRFTLVVDLRCAMISPTVETQMSHDYDHGKRDPKTPFVTSKLSVLANLTGAWNSRRDIEDKMNSLVSFHLELCIPAFR